MAKEKDIGILPPRENPHLFGHGEAEQRFLAEWARGTTHHAYLISGPKGIGKATFAYRVARFILRSGAVSVKNDSLSLFGDAPAAVAAPGNDMAMDVHDPLFRRVAAGSHTDLLALHPAYDPKKQTEKNIISVDDARQVPEFLSLTPAEGDWRVVVIDAVDQLNNQAANALLKIMEEPPEKAILLMVCHEPGSILPTIRSRCRSFALAAPSTDAFGQVLQTAAPHIEVHDYAALYALGYGSPGLAITLSKHKALEHYEGWLAAMRPSATAETRQSFIGSAAGIGRSPEGWAMLLHGWRVAMHRLSLYPHYAREKPIFGREAEYLQEIAAAASPLKRRRWAASASQLLGATDTFNLDKRYSLRLMLDTERLDTQFPAAA